MVRSPLRLLQRRNSEQPDNLSPSPDKAQHTRVESAAQDDAAPATAGDYVPERAQPSEQIVLLLHDPKAGLLTRIWRKAVIWLGVYNITLVFNCLDIWEQVMGNVVVLGSAAMLAYGIWREGSGALRAASQMAQHCSGLLRHWQT